MVQNRNKLIDLFIGNMSNAALHKILEQSAEDEELRKYYAKETLNSIEIAKKYREKINPVAKKLPEQDSKDIRRRLLEKVSNKLQTRISEGYQNIDVNSAEKVVNELLAEMDV